MNLFSSESPLESDLPAEEIQLTEVSIESAGSEIQNSNYSIETSTNSFNSEQSTTITNQSDAVSVLDKAHSPAEILLDLAPQQRNLLLMRPLFDLEHSKGSVTNLSGNAGMMASIDTHYLALNL